MGEDRVVAARPVRAQRRGHGLVQGARGELLPDHQETRHADPLVVRGELVPGEREPGVVPAHADPRPDAEREDDGLARDPPLHGDELRFRRLAQVVGVGNPEMAVGRERRPDHQVRAATANRLGRPGLRRRDRPDLLDGRGEEGQRDRPRPPRPRRRSRPRATACPRGWRRGTARQGPAARRASGRRGARHRTPPPRGAPARSPLRRPGPPRGGRRRRAGRESRRPCRSPWLRSRRGAPAAGAVSSCPRRGSGRTSCAPGPGSRRAGTASPSGSARGSRSGPA